MRGAHQNDCWHKQIAHVLVGRVTECVCITDPYEDLIVDILLVYPRYFRHPSFSNYKFSITTYLLLYNT